MINTTGISLYLQEGIVKNRAILEKGIQVKISYVFTSLNLPESSDVNVLQELGALARICNQAGVHLFVDVSPDMSDRLAIPGIEALMDLGVSSIRLDYGFSVEHIVSLSHDFEIILNASTLTEALLDEYQAAGLDLSNVIACHNYYPKVWTGLAADDVFESNCFLRSYGVRTMMFVAGDEKRGPLYDGLPTVENHRSADFYESLWSSRKEAGTDIVLIGDLDLSEDHWNVFHEFHDNIVALPCDLDARYDSLYNRIFHDRKDSSPYVIRVVESRVKDILENVVAEHSVAREAGSIGLSNSLYGRYSGEIEISRQVLAADARVNVIGQVDVRYHDRLKYINKGQAFMLVAR